MKSDSFFRRSYNTLKEVYKKPVYIAVTVISFIIYYYVFSYLIEIQQNGIFLIMIPTYFIYLLVLSSAIALTLGIFSMRNTRNNDAPELSSGVGTATALIGGVMGGCGCAEPLILNLSVLGLTTTQTFSLLNFVSANQFAIFGLMIAINFFVVIYYLNKLSQPSCQLRKRK
jgi:hypothetical protein